MSRPSSRSSNRSQHMHYNGQHQHQHHHRSQAGGAIMAAASESNGYPFDENSGIGGLIGGRNNTDDHDDDYDDDSSVVMRPSGAAGAGCGLGRDFHHNFRHRHHRLGGGILDAISCLCIGDFDANDYIDNDDDDDDDYEYEYDYDGIVSPKKSVKTPSSTPNHNNNNNNTHRHNHSHRANKNGKRSLLQPVAIVADQVTGELLERRAAQRTRSGSSSFPAGRFVFRPVSDDETTVTGFNSQISRGWEI